MSIREATPDDLDAIMALERASFPTDAWSEGMMREELAGPHGHYVVLERDGTLVGYAGLRALRGAADADIQTIAIAEAARGRGDGRALLRTLLREAARRRVQTVFLDVRADNPVAQALYHSEGFVEAGRRPRYYQPDDVDAVVMTLDLRAWADAAGAGASQSSQNVANSAASARSGAHSAENCEPCEGAAADATAGATDAGAAARGEVQA